jgi:hypothetical protein
MFHLSFRDVVLWQFTYPSTIGHSDDMTTWYSYGLKNLARIHLYMSLEKQMTSLTLLDLSVNVTILLYSP